MLISKINLLFKRIIFSYHIVTIRMMLYNNYKSIGYPLKRYTN